MNDTHPMIEKKMAEMVDKKSPFERLEMCCSMFDFAKELAISSILEKNPKASDAEIRRQIFIRFYGDDFSPEKRKNILDQMA